MTSASETNLSIGIDLGATKIAGALVNRQGAVLAAERRLTGASEGSTAVIQRIADVVRTLLDAAPASVSGIGVGAPGYVDPVAGVVTNAVNLGWDEVNLVPELQSLLGTQIDIWAENDASVMALGEYHYGAATECNDFIYISIGSGMGSGVMVDGALVHGADNRATELGHLSLDPQGRPCACGLRGCVETVVSGPGVLATARNFLARDQNSRLAELPNLTPEDVLNVALQTDDALAKAVFDHTARWLGKTLATCVVLLNPSRIVIGGGLGLAAFDLLAPGVQRELELRVIRQCLPNLQIAPSQVRSSAVGASSLVWYAKRNLHA